MGTSYSLSEKNGGDPWHRTLEMGEMLSRPPQYRVNNGGHGECWVRSDSAGVLVAEGLRGRDWTWPPHTEICMVCHKWRPPGFCKGTVVADYLGFAKGRGRWKTSEEILYGMREMMVVSAKTQGKRQGTLDTTLNTPHSSALSHVLNSWVTWS